MRTLRRIFLLIFLVITALGIVVGLRIRTSINYAVDHDVRVEIGSGASVRKISQILADDQIIHDARIFEYYLRFLAMNEKKSSIRAGEYSFKSGQDFFSVVEQLLSGRVVLYTFTIPEGYNLKQIGEVVVGQKKLMSLAEYERQVKRADLIDRIRVELGVSAITNLEGFLFPDTYAYEKNTKPDEIIAAMVSNFIKRVVEEFGKDGFSAIKKRKMSFLEAVTLASLVEKETGVGSERPLIAGVFVSRLEKGMLLQTDPSVIYGIPNFNGNITSADLKRDTPYNTYTRAGLPPGPIASVGLAALRAAFNPTPTEYLYFVAKGDGSHYFSKSLEEHNQAVRYYQLGIGVAPK